jgi:hypothetical protein
MNLSFKNWVVRSLTFCMKVLRKLFYLRKNVLVGRIPQGCHQLFQGATAPRCPILLSPAR